MVTIGNCDVLYRRLAPGHIVDGAVASNGYKIGGKPDQSISVELANMTTAKECATRDGRVGYKVGKLIASRVRELDFEIRHAPDEAGSTTEAHALIEPIEGQKNTKTKCRLLAEMTELVPEPY